MLFFGGDTRKVECPLFSNGFSQMAFLKWLFSNGFSQMAFLKWLFSNAIFLS